VIMIERPSESGKILSQRCTLAPLSKNLRYVSRAPGPHVHNEIIGLSIVESSDAAVQSLRKAVAKRVRRNPSAQQARRIQNSGVKAQQSDNAFFTRCVDTYPGANGDFI
jgi:hypothetical protein